ncbi:hypothetical protein FJY84_00585 [Candidatus Bathyarchaeota archaeon]|nr:hypothetical protein [Candidatus Bathyarchaeota archaeon]
MKGRKETLLEKFINQFKNILVLILILAAAVSLCRRFQRKSPLGHDNNFRNSDNECNFRSHTHSMD